jgi:hypothetical protein
VKTNFKETKNQEIVSDESSNKELTAEEFEDYVVKSGARGSFMIYRSKNEDEEMGIDEL